MKLQRQRANHLQEAAASPKALGTKIAELRAKGLCFPRSPLTGWSGRQEPGLYSLVIKTKYVGLILNYNGVKE